MFNRQKVCFGPAVGPLPLCCPRSGLPVLWICPYTRPREPLLFVVLGCGPAQQLWDIITSQLQPDPSLAPAPVLLLAAQLAQLLLQRC